MDQPTQTPHQTPQGSASPASASHDRADSPARVNGMAAFPAAREVEGAHDPALHRMDIDFPLLATVAAVSAILVFVIITSTQAWFSREMQKERQIKSYDVPNLPLQDLQREELSHIDSYSWVDNNHQVVTLPIERAMELTIKEYHQRQQAPDKNATEKQ